MRLNCTTQSPIASKLCLNKVVKFDYITVFVMEEMGIGPSGVQFAHLSYQRLQNLMNVKRETDLSITFKANI